MSDDAAGSARPVMGPIGNAMNPSMGAPAAPSMARTVPIKGMTEHVLLATFRGAHVFRARSA